MSTRAHQPGDRRDGPHGPAPLPGPTFYHGGGTMRILRCGTPWALSLALLACAGDGPSGPSGTLRVRITDSPFSEARAAFVTFSEVSAHRDGGDWETLAFYPPGAARTCDLKRLQGAVDVLGVGALAAGT